MRRRNGSDATNAGGPAPAKRGLPDLFHQANARLCRDAHGRSITESGIIHMRAGLQKFLDMLGENVRPRY